MSTPSPLREDLRGAFARLTRPPDPGLSREIRETIYGQPAPATPPRPPAAPVTTGPSRPPSEARHAASAVLVAVALLIAVAAAAIVVGPVGLGRRVADLRGVIGSRASPTTVARASAPAARPTTAPTVAATVEPTSTPTPAPTSSVQLPAPLPGYGCTTQSGGGGAQSTMTAVRLGGQGGYDRFVLQFSGAVPQFEVRPQEKASFTMDASGAGVTLQGSYGLSVTLRNASGAGYTGFRDFQPGLTAIQEAKLLGDGEGVVHWGLGLARPTCFHAWTLGGPSRLVIDIQQP